MPFGSLRNPARCTPNVEFGMDSLEILMNHGNSFFPIFLQNRHDSLLLRRVQLIEQVDQGEGHLVGHQIGMVRLASGRRTTPIVEPVIVELKSDSQVGTEGRTRFPNRRLG